MPRSEPRGSGVSAEHESNNQTPSWKSALALVSLALSLLLWLNGLVTSLQRPSVGDDLSRRQLELTVLAQGNLSEPIRPLLSSGDPLQALQESLTTAITSSEEDGRTPAPELLLEQALLLERTGQAEEATAALQDLSSGTGDPSAIAAALLTPEASTRSEREELLAQLKGSTLLRQWSCEALLGAGACNGEAVARRASAQLLSVTLLPGVGLIAGIALLLRELWRRWRGKAQAAAPWQGPNLSGLDTILLVAGGFVVVGELLTPLLVAPLLTRLLQDLPIDAVLKQGISVVALYGALMAGPLVILRLLLKPLGPGPQGGWLQFRWSPPQLCFGQALKGFLMVLPLVSLVGWLQGQLFEDPGGSNPLLELVLNGHNVPALACFGVTAIVMAPLFEETIFRGVLLPVAARYWGSSWGIVASAAVFAVAHSSLGEFPPLMVLGLGLGWLRWRSGRLGSCVLMHALWNSLTFFNLVVLGW